MNAPNKVFRCSESGGTLIEFALLAPLLMFFAFGAFEVAMVLRTQMQLSRIVRETANAISRDCAGSLTGISVGTSNHQGITAGGVGAACGSAELNTLFRESSNLDGTVLTQEQAREICQHTAVTECMTTQLEQIAPIIAAMTDPRDFRLRITSYLPRLYSESSTRQVIAHFPVTSIQIDHLDQADFSIEDLSNQTTPLSCIATAPTALPAQCSIRAFPTVSVSSVEGIQENWNEPFDGSTPDLVNLTIPVTLVEVEKTLHLPTSFVFFLDNQKVQYEAVVF